MKKTLFTFILFMLTAVMLFSACSDNDDGKNGPFYDPDAGKDQITYIFILNEFSGTTRKATVSSDKGVTLGKALEDLGYIKSENGAVTQVFDTKLSAYVNDQSTPFWKISIDGVETDKDFFSIIPEKETIYTVEMKLKMN